MSALEITLVIVLWVIIGFWISYKNNWYKEDEEDSSFMVTLTVVFAPICLLTNIVRVFIVDEWEQ